MLAPNQSSKAKQEINLSKTKFATSNYWICEISNKANTFSLKIDLIDEDEIPLAEIQSRICQQLKAPIQLLGHYFRQNGIDLSNPISSYIDCLPIYFSYCPITAKSLGSNLAEPRMQIINLRYYSEVKSLFVLPEHTILELIEAFKQCVAVPTTAKIEIKNSLGLVLNECNTLGSLALKDQDSLLVKVVHAGGGINFVDLSDLKNIKTSQWNDKAPAWRCHIPGLNLQGECKNENCVSYKKGRVVMNMGYISFDLIRNRKLCKCPMCNKFVNPTHCSFNNCEYTWSGEKFLDTRETEIYRAQEWRKVGDECLTYEPKESGLAEWVTLKIHTQKIVSGSSAERED